MSAVARNSRRVCHVITQSTPFGGAQRNTLLTVAGLVRDGWDVSLVCGSGGPLIPEAERAGVRVHVVEELVRPVAPHRDLLALARLVRLFQAERYAVVHTHSTKAGLLGRVAARAARVPVVVHTVHGYPFVMTGVPARVYSRLEAAVARLTHRVICVGENLRHEVIAHGMAPAAKCLTVYSGIDFAGFRPQHHPTTMRERLGLGEVWPVVAYVGLLSERKGQQHLIEAVARLTPRYPRLRLLLVGDGPSRAVLEAKSVSLGLDGHVAFLGERDDVADILQVVDVYAMPSLLEGVGRALTEAMSMARPVVATAINGVTELVRHDATGLLVPPQDPSALAAAIDRLAGDRTLAHRVGTQGQRLVQGQMGADRMVANIEHVYATLLERPANLRRPAPGPTASPWRRRTWTRLLPVAAWIGLILFVATRPSTSFVPSEASLGGAPRRLLQYPYHLGMFLFLALLLRRWLSSGRRERGRRAATATLLIAAVVSGTSELLQFWAPARTPALGDVALDLVGAALGVVIGAWGAAGPRPDVAPPAGDGGDATEVA